MDLKVPKRKSDVTISNGVIQDFWFYPEMIWVVHFGPSSAAKSVKRLVVHENKLYCHDLMPESLMYEKVQTSFKEYVEKLDKEIDGILLDDAKTK